MTERDQGEHHQPSSQEIGKELREYLANADFGSPKYLAVTDYLRRDNLRSQWEIALNHVQSGSPGPDLVASESKLRIAEIRLAAILTEIERRDRELKDYGEHLAHLESELESASDACRREVELQNPEADEESIDRYTEGAWEEIFMEMVVTPVIERANSLHDKPA
jgi:hypothetical protein